jgi:SulP family sulfate permease
MAVVFMEYTSMFPDNPSHGAALAFTVVMLGGLFQILFGFLKLGKFINLIPHSVISGFMSGIGVIIILLQLDPLFGYAAQSGPVESALTLPEILTHPVTDDMLLAAMTLLIVFLLPQRINRILPAPLFALVTGTLVLVFWQGTEIVRAVEDGRTVFHLGGAAVLGEIPFGLPAPIFPTIELDLLANMVKSALMLAALGSIDSLLTSLVADNMTRSYHNSDRELIGQGIGNSVAGFFGGLPGAGATMRTVVNIRAGGQTPLSGALHALVLLAIVLGAGVVASYIPNAVLAGILVKVGYDIIDWDYLKRMRHISRGGVSVMATVFFITVFVDLITAVAVGMIMAAFIFMKRMVDLQLDSITAITNPGEESPLSAEESKILEQANGRILLFRVAGPMSFGAAKGMARRLAAFDQFDVLVLDLTDVPQIDYTSSRAVEDMLNGTQDRGREIMLAGCKKTVCDSMLRQSVIDKIGESRLKETRLEALQTALRIVQEK